MKSLISHQQLLQAKRLLYMTHMAIGDYVYQRMFLKKLKDCYPHLQIDLWFDDCVNKVDNWKVRRAETLSQWFSNEPFLDNLYPVAASTEERETLIYKASKENYDLIVFSVDVWSEHYAEIAREISKTAYVVGNLMRPNKFILRKFKAFKQCDGFFIDRGSLARHYSLHITEFYQKRFKKFFGLSVKPEEIRPCMQVPEKWLHKMQIWLKDTKQRHQESVGSKVLDVNKTVFINYLASQDKRNWKLSQVVDLIVKLNQREANWTYIINLPPHELAEVCETLAQEDVLRDIHIVPFTAEENFYELPALILLSDWVLSVETAVIHLASALSVPQIALVRYKAKTWAPLLNEKTNIIFTRTSPVRIYNITVDQVLEEYQKKIKTT